MELDSLTKIAQIIFYSGGLLLGVLTYGRAKSTILNTVNTEYHKKVIEHLAEQKQGTDEPKQGTKQGGTKQGTDHGSAVCSGVIECFLSSRCA